MVSLNPSVNCGNGENDISPGPPTLLVSLNPNVNGVNGVNGFDDVNCVPPCSGVNCRPLGCKNLGVNP